MRREQKWARIFSTRNAANNGRREWVFLATVWNENSSCTLKFRKNTSNGNTLIDRFSFIIYRRNKISAHSWLGNVWSRMKRYWSVIKYVHGDNICVKWGVMFNERPWVTWKCTLLDMWSKQTTTIIKHFVKTVLHFLLNSLLLETLSNAMFVGCTKITEIRKICLYSFV